MVKEQLFCLGFNFFVTGELSIFESAFAACDVATF